LVDDSPDFLHSAARALTGLPGVRVVGQACSGTEGVELAARLHPDVVLMDVRMPDMSGLDATRLLKREPHPPRVVILTFSDLPEYRQAATDAGADAFVTKWELDEQLPALLERLRLWEAYT
jgi:DNA-binding NarL/FixJ family response regulator